MTTRRTERSALERTYPTSASAAVVRRSRRGRLADIEHWLLVAPAADRKGRHDHEHDN
jgi:hypothetical protein